MMPGDANRVVDVETNGVPLPAEYALLGALQGYYPKTADQLRMFIVGLSGEGKTTFNSSIPGAIIFDFELGADAIPGAKATRVTIENYNHYEQWIAKLVADSKAKKKYFTRVVFDTGDEWMHMISHQLATEHNVDDISEYGSQGHGWGLIKSRCWQALQTLQMAGYSWTVVGHLTEKTISNPVTNKEMTVPRPVIFKGLAEQIIRNCDFNATIWRSIYKEQEWEKVIVAGVKIDKLKKEQKTVKKWFFDCRSIDGRNGKDRGVPTMNRKFELPITGGWAVFVEEYNKAIELIKKGTF